MNGPLWTKAYYAKFKIFAKFGHFECLKGAFYPFPPCDSFMRAVGRLRPDWPALAIWCVKIKLIFQKKNLVGEHDRQLILNLALVGRRGWLQSRFTCSASHSLLSLYPSVEHWPGVWCVFLLLRRKNIPVRTSGQRWLMITRLIGWITVNCLDATLKLPSRTSVSFFNVRGRTAPRHVSSARGWVYCYRYVYVEKNTKILSTGWHRKNMSQAEYWVEAVRQNLIIIEQGYNLKQTGKRSVRLCFTVWHWNKGEIRLSCSGGEMTGEIT